MEGTAECARPPLVMVPGLGLGPAAWAPTVRALEERMGSRCPAMTAIPLPGYGLRRGAGDGLLSPAALARRLVAHLEEGQPVVLLGHSASCQVVVHAARLVPGCVAGLVLVGPTTDPRAASWPRLVGRWVGTARREPPWQVPLLVRHYRRSGLWTMGRAMESARTDRIDLVLGAVDCPVLLVRGRDDRIVPADWLASLAAGRARGSGASTGERSCVTLPAGAHMVPLTHGRLVAEAVGGFLAGLAVE